QTQPLEVRDASIASLHKQNPKPQTPNPKPRTPNPKLQTPMSCNDQKNPLQHDGTSQQQRLPPALQASYVQVDERDFADWIMFASRFSTYLNYYSPANMPTGNWQPFFDNDIAATLGSIAIQNIDEYRRAVKERLDFLRDDKNEDDLPALEATLGSLFSAMLTLSIALDSYLFRLPQDHALNTSLQNT